MAKKAAVIAAPQTDDFLDSVSNQSTTKSSTSKIPFLKVSEAVVLAVNEFADLSQQIADLETKRDLEGAVILARTFDSYKESNGSQGSFKIKGDKKTATISYVNKFSPKIETSPALEAHPLFNTFFKKVHSISLKGDDPVKISENVAFLRDKLGDEVFKNIFNVEKKVLVVNDMNVKQFALPPELRPYVKQNKASIKMS